MSRLASVREFFTRERGGPDLLAGFKHLSSEQHKREVDSVTGWAVRVVLLGIAVGLVIFGLGAWIVANPG